LVGLAVLHQLIAAIQPADPPPVWAVIPAAPEFDPARVMRLEQAIRLVVFQQDEVAPFG
jgi:hypothetical protein